MQEPASWSWPGRASFTNRVGEPRRRVFHLYIVCRSCRTGTRYWTYGKTRFLCVGCGQVMRIRHMQLRVEFLEE